MLKCLVALAALLVIVGGCSDVQVSQSGRLIASCATPAANPNITSSHTGATTMTPVASYRGGYAGPCYDGTDRTDRTLRDDRTDRTDRTLRDDLTDRTDRTLRDDITDRTVWCVEPAIIIQAPTFIVFFDFDKSDLTPVAQDTIRRAAAAYKTKGGAQIKASGHTDRAGTDAYNMALSLRRVNAVRDALVREGVAESDISTVALGENQPMVPTADGVREAQNRRVEIVIR